MIQMKSPQRGNEMPVPGLPGPTHLTASQLAQRPALAQHVELCGPMKDSGFEQPQWLVQRGDRYLHITELLYRLLEEVDGKRTLEEIAACVSKSVEQRVRAEHVHYLLATKLVPAGLVSWADGVPDVTPTSAKGGGSGSPLGVNLRLK